MKFLHYRDLAKTETEFPISAEWGQGRSIFGGLTAALVLVHIESNVDLTGLELRPSEYSLLRSGDSGHTLRVSSSRALSRQICDPN